MRGMQFFSTLHREQLAETVHCSLTSEIGLVPVPDLQSNQEMFELQLGVLMTTLPTYFILGIGRCSNSKSIKKGKCLPSCC